MDQQKKPDLQAWVAQLWLCCQRAGDNLWEEIFTEESPEGGMIVAFRFTESPPKLLYIPMKRLIQEHAKEAGFSVKRVDINPCYVQFLVASA